MSKVSLIKKSDVVATNDKKVGGITKVKKAPVEVSAPTTKKVLWFSRHSMTPEQESALGGNIEIMQVNKTINSAYEIQDDINKADIIAIVAPINLQQQFLKLAGTKPVIMAVNDRVLVQNPEGGEDKVMFQFVKWEQLDKIEVVKHDFIPQ